MTDIRETLGYQFVLAEVEAADIRETLGYQFVLAEVESADVRGTLAYQFVLNQGEDVIRDTFTYFYVLAKTESIDQADCGFLSVIIPGPMGLNSPLAGDPLAFQSSFGSIGEVF